MNYEDLSIAQQIQTIDCDFGKFPVFVQESRVNGTFMASSLDNDNLLLEQLAPCKISPEKKLGYLPHFLN